MMKIYFLFYCCISAYNLDMATKKEYVSADLSLISATPDEIISGSLDDEIRSRMIQTVETEAPILESLLFKRVINSFSLKKVGSRILPVFDRIASTLPFRIEEDCGERVFIKDGNDISFRPTPDSAVRYSYQIPTEEAASCLIFILEREDRTVTKSELSKLFLEEMGYERMGAQVEALFRRASKSPGIKRTGNGRFTK